MTEQPCAGPCNRSWREAQDAYRKALAEYDPLDPQQSRPEPPSAQPWPGEPVWCREDAAKVSLKLAQLDTLAAMLAATADGHRGQGDSERVSRSSAHAPSPSPAADDLDELASMLAGWEDAYRSIKGWPSAPPRGDLASAETERVAWLSRHLRGILADPDIGPDFGNEVLAWHRGMSSKAKAGVRTLRKPMRCPRCRLLSLTWTEGSDRVECGDDTCGLSLTRAQYEAEVERTAAAISAGEYEPEEAGAA